MTDTESKIYDPVKLKRVTVIAHQPNAGDCLVGKLCLENGTFSRTGPSTRATTVRQNVPTHSQLTFRHSNEVQTLRKVTQNVSSIRASWPITGKLLMKSILVLTYITSCICHSYLETFPLNKIKVTTVDHFLPTILGWSIICCKYWCVDGYFVKGLAVYYKHMLAIKNKRLQRRSS